MILSQYVERYGAAGVLGRPLYAQEIMRIAAIENILYAYRSEQKALNWAAWAGQNPKLAAILKEVRNLVAEE